MKRLNTLFAAIALTALVASTAHAALQVIYQDIKTPTQVQLEHQIVGTGVQNGGASGKTGPSAASTDYVMTAYAPSGASGATAVTLTVAQMGGAFLAQPDYPRSLIVRSGAGPNESNYNDVAAGTVTVKGTNIFGKAISEDFTIAVRGHQWQYGAKAFATITSIIFPAESSPYNATFSVGIGGYLGLHRCLANAGDFFHSELNGVKETTAPTIAQDATHIESNTVDLNSALNGNQVENVFFQNFRCLPGN